MVVVVLLLLLLVLVLVLLVVFVVVVVVKDWAPSERFKSCSSRLHREPVKMGMSSRTKRRSLSASFRTLSPVAL